MIKNREGLKLIEPALALKTKFITMAKEFQAEGDDTFQEILGNFNVYIENIKSCALGENLPEGWVRANEYWLIDAEKHLLGKSGLRHQLTEFMKYERGHIGYRIRPSERGKGYGTILLDLTLKKAKEMGMKKILITCDKSNTASYKIIEKNSGKLENEVISKESGEPVLRYWVNLSI